jgi:hypothetical protein
MSQSYDLAAIARQTIDSLGGTSAFARQLGYTRQRVHYWRGRGVPVRDVLIVQKMLGIHPRTIRPDIFINAPVEPVTVD